MTDGTVLLVEDNPQDEALVLRALEQSSVHPHVVVAHDGAEALDYLFAQGAHAGRDASEVPAVMLLDLKLPRIDGLEVLRRVRSSTTLRRLPVVIFTSSNEDADLLRGYTLGANSYVRKPVRFADLSSAVQQLGVYWLRLNERPPK